METSTRVAVLRQNDLTRFGRRTPLDLAVHGDVAATLDAVLPLVEPKRDRSFLDDMLRAHTRALEQVVDAYTRDIEHHLPIHPEYAANILDEVAAEDAVFTVDTGMCNVWAARYITPNGRRPVIGSFLHGTMANALPHAIGPSSRTRAARSSRCRATAGSGCCSASCSRWPSTASR
jgi:pyruvate dehydrogenase (quinone)